MSFGFSVGDFLAVIKLANGVRKDFAGAPDQFHQISSEVRNLAIVLQDVDTFLDEHDLVQAQEESLGEVISNCRGTLEDIHRILNTFSALELKEDGIRKRARRVWQRVKWEPDEIRDLRSRVTSNVTALNAFITSYTRDGVIKLVERQDEEKNKAILNWLAPADFATQQSDLIKRRQAGTGQWLLDSPEYAKWSTSKGELLFCHGIPGAGKTMLSSIVVDSLQKRCYANTDVALCYFYCDFRRQEEQLLEKIVLSLLRQLGQAMSPLPTCFTELFDRYKTNGTRPTFEDALRTFRSVTASFSTVFVVVDALDECQSSNGCQRQLVSELIDFNHVAGANILVTSRPLPHITQRFPDFASVEILASGEDIKKYVEGNMQDLPGFVSRNLELQSEITNGIIKAVHGMFLLAKLHLDSLKGKRSARDLRKTLASLTGGDDAYTKAYSNTMDRIRGQLKEQEELAIQALMWVVHAKRPLTTVELRHALGAEIGETEFFEDNVPDLQDTISVCCGLLTVDEQSDIVRLVHYTTQEFFEATGHLWFPNAQDELLNTCLTYLSFDSFAGECCKDWKDLEDRLDQFPLYKYSSQYWSLHADAEEDSEAIRDFLGRADHVQASVQAWEFPFNLYEFDDIPYQVTALHLSALFGLSTTTDILLQTHDPDVKDSQLRSPLYYAARYGREATARSLLNRNAQVDFPDKNGQTALYCAARNGHEGIARMLLDEGAQYDQSDKYGNTPLSMAARNGHEGIARMLLDKGAQYDQSDEDGYTPLSWAARNGHEGIARMLLDKGARTDIADTCFGWASLFWAAVEGHENITRMLLIHGADGQAKDFAGRTALFYAIRRGQSELVAILCADTRIEAGIQDHYGSTLMSIAARHGYENIVRQLAELPGIDVVSGDNFGRTPLWWAQKQGHSHIVEKLRGLHGTSDPLSTAGLELGCPLDFVVGEWHCDIATALGPIALCNHTRSHEGFGIRIYEI
ncbi:uncharacterized protein JN550_000845 [Neoarthrinium moseri]|uniref:uncharacterized protein n=1 Tax=Neoarthrinium moseri TaxID=1658444 RepID=UPI001FDBE727|nr:uncharacterized protein JN550_000845 [Neoarthrinium moseri]KAI1876773.1 hypothetical protein JN550_000845 [Neoarthrinium moseri]